MRNPRSRSSSYARLASPCSCSACACCWATPSRSRRCRPVIDRARRCASRACAAACGGLAAGWTSLARAHDALPVEAARSWTWTPWLWLGLAASTALFIRGRLRLRRRLGATPRSGCLGVHGRLGYGVAVLFVFARALHTGALGALMSFASRPRYPAQNPGLDALADQQVSGFIMWTVAGTWLTGLGLALFVAWLGQPGRRAAALTHDQAALTSAAHSEPTRPN
jgi:hypothetical protein